MVGRSSSTHHRPSNLGTAKYFAGRLHSAFTAKATAHGAATASRNSGSTGSLQEALEQLGCRWHPTQQRFLPPSEPTQRRTLKAVDADLVDKELGLFLERKTQGTAVAVDGKALRGAVDENGKQVHLLGVLVHKSGVLIGQRQVDGKDNEITEFKPLLEPLDLAGKVVTADAMHTQREHARHLVEDKCADCLFTVTGNQGSLQETLEALDDSLFSPQESWSRRATAGLRPGRSRPAPASMTTSTFPTSGRSSGSNAG